MAAFVQLLEMQGEVWWKVTAIGGDVAQAQLKASRQTHG
jgi:hypothetical protein